MRGSQAHSSPFLKSMKFQQKKKKKKKEEKKGNKKKNISRTSNESNVVER